MAEPDDSPPPPAEPWSLRIGRWNLSSMLVISIAVHLLFGVAAAVWVVSHYSAQRKLTFNAGPKSPNPSERALQHRVQMQKMNRSMPESVPKRVLTTGLAKVALPPMPEINVPKTAATTPMMSGSRAGNFGATGAMGGGNIGGTGSGTAINFFGIRDTATSVVIMIDISDSMFGRTGDYDYNSRRLVRVGKEQSFQHIRDEAIKLVQNLTPGARFGIIRWSGGAYSWKPELVPATEENKQAAIAHIQNDLDVKKAPPRDGRPGGTRHDYALEEAFKLKPETIYMLTDGNARGAIPEGGEITPEYLNKIVDEGQKSLSKKAKLHAIYYINSPSGAKPDEERMLRSLANRTGGTLIKVKARDAAPSQPSASPGEDGDKAKASPTPRDRDRDRDKKKKNKRR